MCSICGIYDPKGRSSKNKQVCETMNSSMIRRGPDDSGSYAYSKVNLGHNRLAVIDVENGAQPMKCRFAGREYVICYNGEIYNSKYLAKELTLRGVSLKTRCDTELVLYSYVIWKEKCVDYLDGIFAFCVYDINAGKLFFARDRFGVKPFFYTYKDGVFCFASEIKALLESGYASRKVAMQGLWQLLFMAPARVNGEGIFKDILELKPAHCGTCDMSGLKISRYWLPKVNPVIESAGEAALHTRFLLENSIKRQLVSDVPLSVLLSGGLDSSVVSAVAAFDCRENGKTLSTYSFEYEKSKENFKPSAFMPQADDGFAVYMAEWLGTEHTVLVCPTEALVDCLYYAVDARDFPGQADIDASLLYYCNRIKQNHTVVLSGECSDEIFGGYPWFYRPEMLHSGYFPWIHEPMQRINLFRSEIVKPKEGFEYTSKLYSDCINECPLCEGESEEDKNARIATWLSVNYFMSSLLERKDRMSMYSGVEVRVPFADHKLFEYVFNVPWSIKFENRVEKALLRNAMSSFLPERILYRKKSPFPKTFDPAYTSAVKQHLSQRLDSGNSILSEILDKDRLSQFESDGSGTTWLGQLMAKPQLIAWLLQFDYWYDKYNVEFEF